MCTNTLDELFQVGLQEMYYNEQQLVDALDELESTTDEAAIQAAFSEHRTETEGHIERLEEIFEMMDTSPDTKEDKAVEGMIENHEVFVSQDPDQHVLDRFNLTAGQMSEHYEIAAYGNLIPLADQLGLDEAADILEQNMREEQDALDKLSAIGEEYDYGQLPTG